MRRFGNVFYGVLVIVVSIGGMWLGLMLSNVTSLADLRSRLHASVGSLSMLFGNPVAGTTTAAGPVVFAAHGEITAMDELPVTSPHSARIVSVSVKEDAMVEKGAILFRLDDREAQAQLRSAQSELASAKLELERLNASASTPTPAPAPVPGTKAADVAKALESGYNEVGAVFINLQWITAGLESVLYGEDVNSNAAQQNLFAYSDMIVQRKPDVTRYRDKAASDYSAMREAYLAALAKYRDSSQDSDAATKEALMHDTYDTLKSVNAALKSTSDFLAYVDAGMQSQGVPSILKDHESKIADASRTANDNLSSMFNAIDALTSANAEAGIPVATDTGPSADQIELDKKDAQLRVESAQIALQEAQRNLADYVVRAPVSGKVVGVDGKPGMSVVNGEIVLSIASPQNVARVTLSEADVGKVRTGEGATITFDAIQGFALDGTVFKVDSQATVQDGNVFFNALIAIPEDPRTRPGMTITATFKP